MSVHETTKRRKKRKIVIFLEIFILLAIVIGGGGYFYLQHQLDQTMGNKVRVFDVDVSLLSVSDAAQKIQDSFGKVTLQVIENDNEVYRVSFKDAGITLDNKELESELEKLKEKQGSTRLFGEEEKNYSIPWSLSLDQEKIAEAAKEENFRSDTDLVDAQDAYMTYDEESGFFIIIPDVTGNRINEEYFAKKISDKVSETLGANPLSKDISVVLDEDSYISATILSDDEELNEHMSTLNNKIQGYLDSVITYDFGEEHEIIDADMIRSWIIVDGEEISLDEEQIWNYANNLATTYNTLYIPRYLESSLGGTVELSNNEYGYWIETDEEFDQILSDLQGGEPVEREPVYDTRGYMRNGVDDLCGNYVEISIEKQHLWMYKNGELVTETDVVTGQPEGINTKTKEKESWATYTGAYELAYKESPSTLSSDIYGYSVEVQYWMPFVLGQGLHDLASRSAFGGNIYQTNGSHGCVNLPSDQVAIIYENIEEGYPILIY